MSSILARTMARTLQHAGRGYSSEVGANVTRPAFYRVKRLQKKFSQDDGVPVHLKGGTKDRLLLKASWALVLLGDVLGLKMAIWDLSVHKWLQTF